jgi:Fur family ferric uptake transcriptional regulator/Fur family peroxide stress response transcriptional regulator
VVEASDDHPSAAVIYDRVRQVLPGIGFATVYRNLSALVQAGKIREVRLGETSQYDRRVDRHDHVICGKCGRLADVEFPVPPGALAFAEEQSGFVITDHHVELYGLCPNCL